jgi:hypothetical protein
VTFENQKKFKSPGVDQIAAELIKIMCVENVVLLMWSECLNMYRNYYGQYLVENVCFFFPKL